MAKAKEKIKIMHIKNLSFRSFSTGNKTCLFLPGIYYISNSETFYLNELCVMCKTNLVRLL